MPRLEAILDEVLARGATDLHLSPGHPPLARRAGELERIGERPLDRDELRRMILEVLDADQRARVATDLAIDVVHAHGPEARFEGRCFHDANGLSAVLRLLPSRVRSLDDLGCPPAVQRACERRAGLILCAGPRRSGRTTTAAAMIGHVNRTRACRVLTVEQPAEIPYPPGRAQILHREVGADTPSFAAGIRSAAREDVDVLLVGELTGREAMRATLDLATGGALVVAVVLARGACGALDAVTSAFGQDERPYARALLADALAAVVALELLPRADGGGVVSAHEILLGSPALASMIRDDRAAEIPSLMQAGGAAGMQTMDAALERLLASGLVTAESALSRATDRDAFQRSIGRRTGPLL